MGRPEKKIPHPDLAVGRLAQSLRTARANVGLTYAQLADKAGYSRATLQRAASGKRVPPPEVVRAYALGCGLNPGFVMGLWHQAQKEKARSSGSTSSSDAPRLNMARDEADLGAVLAGLHHRAGAPSLRVMQRRTELVPGTQRLSRSTLHRIVRRRIIPQTRERMEAFLVACDVAPHKRRAWMEAWKRVRATTENERDRRRRQAQIRAQQLDAMLTGPRGEDTARRLMRKAGLVPTEKFPGPRLPWGARCTTCASWGRFRLAQVVDAEAGCVVCAAAHLGNPAPPAHAQPADLTSMTGALDLRILRHSKAAAEAAAAQERPHLSAAPATAPKFAHAP
ncbi:helix-turn-helix domain-containing protein [Streptomyces xanthophaeus]